MLRFLKLMGYETKRIFRNKLIFGMLLGFCVLLICSLFLVQSSTREYVVAVYTDGIENAEESDTIKIMNVRGQTKLVEVDSAEKGMDMLRRGDAIFFLRLSAALLDENGEGPVTATIYYDGSSYVINNIVDDIKDERDRRAYIALVDFLNEWGISVNSAYFRPVEFRQVAQKGNSEKTIFTHDQMAFGLEIAACVYLILLLGIAYSLARDRETQVSKNISYIPIGHNTYFLSKIVPFFILGMLEMLLICVLGAKLLGIAFQVNLFVVWALSSFFVMATIAFSLLCSMMKNQISSVFLGMMSLLIPLFVEILVVIPALPTYMRVILNFFPVTAFMRFFNGMVYNGLILWKNIFIFLGQTVGYYLLALFVIKKQS